MSSLAEIQLKNNRNERLPCIIVVDGSTSMKTGGAIDLLNSGLQTFESELKSDDANSVRTQVLVVRVGGDASVLSDWTDAIAFSAPLVTANGGTPLGEGVMLAMGRLQEHKDMLKANNVTYKRPWFFLMTDGEPTDAYEAAAAACRDAQAQGKFTMFPIAVGPQANAEKLKEFGLDRPVVAIEAARFKDMFVSISASMKQASTGPKGASVSVGPWGQVVA